MGAFDYPVSFGEPTTETDFATLDDAPTAADFANDEADQREAVARRGAVVDLDEFSLQQELESAEIPFADLYAKGLPRARLIEVYGRIVLSVIENYIDGEVAIRTAKPVHWNTHPEDIGDGPVLVSPADIVRRTLLVLGVEMQIPGGLA